MSTVVVPQHPAAGRARSGRSALVAAALAGALLLGACGADPVTGTGAIDGTYALQTVDNKTLPTTVFDSTLATGHRVTVVVTGATMTLYPDSSYTFALSYTFAVDGAAQSVAPLGDSGSYARTGSSLLFTSFVRGAPMSGTVSNGELTMALDILGTGTPLVLVYHR